MELQLKSGQARIQRQLHLMLVGQLCALLVDVSIQLHGVLCMQSSSSLPVVVNLPVQACAVLQDLHTGLVHVIPVADFLIDHLQ